MDQPELLEGNSLEAGLAAGIVCQLLRAAEHGEEYATRQDVAITGRIDETGRLLPVDEAGLRVKVEACLFSPMRILVVPREQEALCNEFLSRSRLSFEPSLSGSRSTSPVSFDVVGASSLEDIFNNRLLTVVREVRLHRRLARRIWKRRRPVAALSLLGMAILIARLAYGPLDKNPTQGRFVGNMLIVENRHGEKLREIPVGEHAVLNANTVTDGGQSKHLDVFSDVDSDGVNDIIWAQAREKGAGDRYEVVCWSSREDRELWRTPIDIHLQFPEKPSGNDAFYTVLQMAAGDFDNDGVPEVIVSARSTFFAHIVLELNGRDGTIKGTYVHIGQLLSLETADLDGDGITEILVCGINNAYEQACLAVLDPRHLGGHGPLTDRYRLDSIPPARHRAYFLIPRTLVGEAYHGLSKSNKATDVVARDNVRRRVSVQILDVSELPNNCSQVTQATYFLFLDRTLTPTEMETGDDYDILSRRLAEEGKIPFRPDLNQTYMKQYMNSLLYWTGAAWKRTAGN